MPTGKMFSMTYEEFLKKFHGQALLEGFSLSETQIAKLAQIYVDQLDEVRKAKGSLRIPGFAVLKTKVIPAATGVMIAGRSLNRKAQQRFTFTPVKAAREPISYKVADMVQR